MVIAPELDAAVTTSAVLRAAFPTGDGGRVSNVRLRHIYVIPQGSEPRWIIVGDPRKIHSVLCSWRPYKLSSRIGWSAISTAASVGLLAKLPGVQSSQAEVDFSYWQRWMPALGGDWQAIIHVGNPSHTRKASVFFVSGEGAVQAVVKVPLTRIAGKFILNEADVLSRLCDWKNLPQVLFQDSNRGVAAQTWLAGKPISRSFTRAHLELLCSFATPGVQIRVSDQRAEIATQLNKVERSFDRDILARGQELLDFNEPMPAFVEHRDFAPWNLKCMPDGNLGIVDWEWAVLKSLPWQDICRFFFMRDVLFNGPGRVWQSMCANPLLQSYRRQFQIPAHALRPLTMHYLLRVLCMDSEIKNTRLTDYTYRQIQALLAES